VSEAATAYIGTSGWNYKHWRNLIYPERTPQKRWLDFIVQHFHTVEVNTSFYRIPRKETVASWAASTPDHFRFALKLWRGITHYRKLTKSDTLTANFLDVAQQLPPGRRAPLLIQLPPNQGRDVERLISYVRLLRQLSDKHWSIAIEFRNSNWLDADTFKALDKENVALCIHDMLGKGDTDRANNADFVYMRRHGANEGRYAGSYSPEQLRADADRIRAWTDAGRQVFVYYNNDIGGHAFWNARDLQKLVDAEATIL
jgi:uncharacterized protein YecE (DUF72 family)